MPVEEGREQSGEVVHGVDVLLENRHRQHLAVVGRLENERAQAGLGNNQAPAGAELPVALEKAGVERVEVLLEAGSAAACVARLNDCSAAVLTDAACHYWIHAA